MGRGVPEKGGRAEKGPTAESMGAHVIGKRFHDQYLGTSSAPVEPCCRCSATSVKCIARTEKSSDIPACILGTRDHQFPSA